jgi:hypothetical protein
MSYQASAHAAHACEIDANMSTAARLVLYVMAETANGKTGECWGGDRVARRAGLTPGSARRAVRELITAGHVVVLKTRPGRATQYRIPFVAKLSTTRSHETGSDEAIERPRGPIGALPGPIGALPGPIGPRTSPLPVDVPHSARATLDVSGEWCTTACTICEGTQWETQTPDRPYAVPCPNRPPREPIAL